MKSTDRRTLLIAILIFIFFVLGISISSILYYWAESDSQKKRALENIESIAQLKVDQISQWRKERLGDADVIVSNPFIVESLRAISLKGQRNISEKRLRDYLDIIKKSFLYESWAVLDFGYDQIMSSSDINQDILNNHPFIIGKIEDTPFLSSIHFDGDGTLSIDLVIPISSGGSRFILLFSVNPSDFLFPLVQSWPGASGTGETMLVERSGNEILILNDLRNKKGVALNLRLALRDDLPGAKAVNGIETSMEGRDYRGIRVLAATRYIKGAEWGLVAKMDLEEILSPLKMRLVFVVASLMLLCAASGAAVLFFWQRQLTESRLADAQRYRDIAEELRDTWDRFLEAQQMTHLGNWDWRIRENTHWWSDEIFRILGLTPGEVAPSMDLIKGRLHPADRLFVANSIDRSIKINEPLDIEFRIVLPDGPEKIIHVIGKVYYDNLGSPLRMVGIMHDLSESKRSEELYRTLFEQSPIPKWVFAEESLRFLAVNEAAIVHYGYSREDFLNMTIKEIRPEKEGPFLNNILASTHGGDWKGEVRHRKRDGSVVEMVLWTRPFEMYGQKARLVVAHDITSQKMAENKMKEAMDIAETASRAKSDFLANMSHEIRTPMNAVIGMAELLSETPLTEEQSKYVDIFRRAGDNLMSLIDDILDLSKIEAVRLELENIDFDLNETIERAVEMFQFNAHKKGLELSYYIKPNVPMFIKGDPGRLRQIILNIVGNAIKFTDKGEVVLEVGAYSNTPLRTYANEEVELLFSVRDTGIGIVSNKLDTIFESFSQAHSSTSSIYGGTGLGLTIAKSLVEVMGGNIWVESKVGEGSTFYFTVKLGVATKKFVNKTKVSLPEGQKTLTILLVDDSEDNRLIIESYLRKYSHKIETAGNGEEAVTSFKKGRYDLVLMDMHMPVMSGYTATKEIRKWEAETGKSPVPIIALTAYAFKEDVENSLKAGCTSHISKPVKIARLLEVIGEYAGKG